MCLCTYEKKESFYSVIYNDENISILFFCSLAHLRTHMFVCFVLSRDPISRKSRSRICGIRVYADCGGEDGSAPLDDSSFRNEHARCIKSLREVFDDYIYIYMSTGGFRDRDGSCLYSTENFNVNTIKVVKVLTNE